MTRSDLDALKEAGYEVSEDVARLNKANPASAIINDPAKLRKLREKIGLPKESEDNFLSWIIDYAKLRGWLHYHTWRSFHSPSGFPDLILIRNRRIIVVELKSERGKLSVYQDEWLKAFKQTGISTFVWKPSDRDEIIRELTDDEETTSKVQGMRDMPAGVSNWEH